MKLKLGVDVSHSASEHPIRNKIGRALWNIVWLLFFRPSPRLFHAWRCFLLRLFGAQVGYGVHPYPSAKIWAPWNLVMEDYSCLADSVDCYCVATIRIGAHSTISQYSYLCGATHDYEHSNLPLIPLPITIGSGVWVAADVFVGPGVHIGDGAVIGARSTVVKDVNAWVVVAGNPARFIKNRELQSHDSDAHHIE